MSDPKALASKDFPGVAKIEEKMLGKMDYPCKPWKVSGRNFRSTTHPDPALHVYAVVILEERLPEKGRVVATNLPFLPIIEEPAE
jgi:hypothetical protein